MTLVLNGFQSEGYSVEGAVQGRAHMQLIGGAIYLLSAGLFLRFKRRVVYDLIQSPITLALVGYVAASVFWSAEPALSLRRAIGLTGTTLFAAYLAFRFSPYEVLRLLTVTYTILVVVTFLLLGLPDLGWSRGGTVAIGGWGHKNNLGRGMVLATLTFWMFSKTEVTSRTRWGLYGLMAGAVLLLVLAQSGSATLTIVMTFGVFLPLFFVLSRVFRRASLAYVVALCLVAIVGTIAANLAYEIVLNLLGKDPTLTNRTVIWSDLSELARSRFWFGHGFGGFWESSATKEFHENWPTVGHSHNGFMDAWLELGVVGVGLLIAAVSISLQKTANAFFLTRAPSGLFFICVSLIMLTYNTVGRVYPEHNSLYWVLFIYVLLNPAFSIKTRKQRYALSDTYGWADVKTASANG